ncbi:class I adenylate-forming enzyme family protein [Lentzea nigeriaca]|uniref:class I adenylate-forming enzyme family protein n=1 Tax=Lentzea nigeriaca TaxID=1128665 RepID=UPI00195B3EDE|nr:class I adenylate-forming enzyme family protein [Lentzea nigeriaca]MBM7861042.1 acyl-coenzyme A synthetase/AMP-(fatty) acid ligase [Lentzea nigeriaca]
MISKAERAQVLADVTIGAGNVIHRLKAYGRPLDEEVLRTDGTWQAPDGSHPAALTLGDLHAAVEVYASWFHAQGVKPRDIVAVQTRSSTEFAVNYLALTSLGAIPSFVNGNLRPEIAREYIRRQRVVGAVADDEHARTLADDDLKLGFLVTAADIAEAGPLPENYPYRHHSTDPIIISHSSGTTGMPKAVPHTHETLLYAQLYRLKLSVGDAMGRLLVALPGSHNAAVSVMLFGFLLRSPVLLLSSQRGTDVLDAIEEFRPTTVFAFAGTYGEIVAEDLAERDLESVEAWYNTGDAIHEAYVRELVTRGSHVTVNEDFQRVRVPGSVFTDGLGSSEAGYSIFHIGHRAGSATYGRCIGKAIGFAEAAVLSEDGQPLPAGVVGRLGVRSPTLTPGYWNDSLTFYQLRLGGYWLTGDLAVRDEEGNFYHLDRVPDAIRTSEGIVFSTCTEELLLAELPELADCTVVGVAPEGVRADWEGDGVADAYALLQVADGGPDDAKWTELVNDALRAKGFPPVTRALRMDAADVIKGATGKVLKRLMRERFSEQLAGGRG